MFLANRNVHAIPLFIDANILPRPFALRGNVTSLVELALAEQDYKNAAISFFSSSVVLIDNRYWFLYYFHEIF